MTIDRIRSALRQQPFRPFTLRTVDGREYEVRHPELVALSQARRPRDIVYAAPDQYIIIDVGLIVSLSLAEEPAEMAHRDDEETTPS